MSEIQDHHEATLDERDRLKELDRLREQERIMEEERIRALSNLWEEEERRDQERLRELSRIWEEEERRQEERLRELDRLQEQERHIEQEPIGEEERLMQEEGLTEEEKENIKRALEASGETYEQERLRRQQTDGETMGEHATTTVSDGVDPVQRVQNRPEAAGQCVVCQDEQATMAIVDCGHLALCASCSDLIMKSTQQCPLCRGNIENEQRLVRIYRT